MTAGATAQRGLDSPIAFSLSCAAAFALFACGPATAPPEAPIAHEEAAEEKGDGKTDVADPAALKSLDEGERIVDVAGGDCDRACEGLAEMTKARVALCAPRTSACDDAERREGDATRKVAAFCAPCPPP